MISKIQRSISEIQHFFFQICDNFQANRFMKIYRKNAYNASVNQIKNQNSSYDEKFKEYQNEFNENYYYSNQFSKNSYDQKTY